MKRSLLQSIPITIASFLLVTAVVFGATTIGTNITTGGNITVAPAFGIDTSAAGALNIGTTTATTISIGGSQALTSILGNASTTMVSLSGALWIGGNATTTSAGAISTQSTLAVTATSSLATTTVNRFLAVGSTTPQHGTADVLVDGTATTTLQLSTSGAATVGTCIQMKTVAGANARAYVNAAGNAFIVEAGLCK